MAIYKAKQQAHYAQIPNATLRDKRLSFEARGVLAMLLSLPEDWGINIAWICKQSPNSGRDRVSRILKELQEFGYMVKRVKQGEKGKLDGVDWDVYLEPVSLETRNTVNPSPGESATTKKELNKEKVITNILGSSEDKPAETTAKQKKEYPPEFESLWSAKPNRQGGNPKASALNAYNARLRSGAKHEDIAAGLERYKQYLKEQQKENTQYVMQMATFLGPDEHYNEPWTFNTPANPQQQQRVINQL